MLVRFYATLRPIVGSKTVELVLPNETTVRGLVHEAVRLYPALGPELLDARGDLHGHVHVFVNGRDSPYLSRGFDTPITAGDKVDIFPAVAGG